MVGVCREEVAYKSDPALCQRRVPLGVEPGRKSRMFESRIGWQVSPDWPSRQDVRPHLGRLSRRTVASDHALPTRDTLSTLHR